MQRWTRSSGPSGTLSRRRASARNSPTTTCFTSWRENSLPALPATGSLLDLWVEALDAPNGKVVVFHVRERAVVVSVTSTSTSRYSGSAGSGGWMVTSGSLIRARTADRGSSSAGLRAALTRLRLPAWLVVLALALLVQAGPWATQLDRWLYDAALGLQRDPAGSALDPLVVGNDHYDTARAVQGILQRYKSLQDIINDLSSEKKASVSVQHQILRGAASAVRRLHAARILHRSLYPKHLFVRWPSESVPEVVVIDLERSRFKWFSAIRTVYDLATLNRRVAYLRQPARMFFFLQYLGVPRLNWWHKFLCRLIIMRTAKD